MKHVRIYLPKRGKLDLPGTTLARHGRDTGWRMQVDGNEAIETGLLRNCVSLLLSVGLFVTQPGVSLKSGK